MPNAGRTTCTSITTIEGIKTPEFMSTLWAFQTGFSVRNTGFDSALGAHFTGTIKPSTIVTKWFDDDAFSPYWRQNVAHIAAHQHQAGGPAGLRIELISEISKPSKTGITIATSSRTNADTLMRLLRAFQVGFGVEAKAFDSEHGAVLTGTVKPSTIVTKWFDKIPYSLSKHVAKISVL